MFGLSRENYLHLAILTLLIVVAYANSLGNDFVADDFPSIVNNPNITKLEYALSRPLSIVSNLLDFSIVRTFGHSPEAFRAVNIFFHLGNVWLTYLLLRVLLGSKVAFFTAAILAVHPIQTEAVTWISGGPYARYSFFILLALVLYTVSDKNRRLYFASIGSFILALSMGEKAVVFPLLLAALETAGQSIRKNWKRLIAPFILGGVWGLIYAGKVGERMVGLQTKSYVTPQTINPLLQIPIAITSYLELIFWPKNLTLYHSEMTFSQAEYLLRLLVFIAFLGLITYAYKKNKPVFFFLSLFVISLLPTLTPLGISWIVAERYVYLGAVGIFAVVVMVIQKIGEKFGNPKISYTILIPVLLVLTARTIVRNADWKNQDTLWLAAAKTSPSSPQNHNNLGDLYGRWGDLERSVEEFQKAIELNPSYADAYHNLGNTYQQMGKLDEAIENYKKAAELNPGLWQSCQNLAAIYFEQEKFELAKDWMEKAVATNPENPNLQRNLEIINAQLSTP